MAFLLPKLPTPCCRSPPNPPKSQLALPGGGRFHGPGSAQGAAPIHLNFPLLLSASPQEAPTAKSGDTRSRGASGGGGDPRRSDFYLNLGTAVRTLRDDLPAVFVREPNYDIYR
jgi:hypothetical protein